MYVRTYSRQLHFQLVGGGATSGGESSQLWPISEFGLSSAPHTVTVAAGYKHFALLGIFIYSTQLFIFIFSS